MAILEKDQIEKRREELIVLFDHAPIKRHFGMEFHYDGDSAIFELPYHPGLAHTFGGVHGGVIATLIDNAGWFTAAAYYDTWIATAEFQVRLLEHVAKEDIYSKGRMIRIGGLLAVAGMEVWTKKGRLVATGSGSFAVSSMSTK